MNSFNKWRADFGNKFHPLGAALWKLDNQPTQSGAAKDIIQFCKANIPPASEREWEFQNILYYYYAVKWRSGVRVYSRV